jgi:hypothetical protein
MEGGEWSSRTAHSDAAARYNPGPTSTSQGDSAMTPIPPDRSSYALQRRYASKKGGKPLKGFAFDVTVRFNTEGTAFLQDHNSDGSVMPFTALGDLRRFLDEHIERNYVEHYGSLQP